MATTQKPHPKISNAKFHTTRWSVVLAAQEKSSRSGAESLEALCQQYWPPLYAFVRLRGHSEHDAQDLTQEFFARLLEKEWLTAADQQRGRFRTFLLTAMKRFLANEWDRTRAQKRGGAAKIVNMDTAATISIPDKVQVSAEALFDRQWALTLLESVMVTLCREYESTGRTSEFELLKPSLTAERGATDYAALAVSLGIQPASVRSSVHRLRQRFRELFRAEVAGTVADAADVDTEMQAVISALR